MASLMAKDNSLNPTGWVERHNAVVLNPSVARSTLRDTTIALMLKSWQRYAEQHKRAYGSPITQDYVLGPHWEAIGQALRGLLDGNTGDLDCGTLDTFISDTLAENGLKED